MTSIRLDFPPSANRYWRRGPHGTYISKEAREYREKVALACDAKEIIPMNGPLNLFVFAAMPASNRDLGNTEKILSDALQGHMFGDDVQIVSIHLYRCDAPKPKKVNAHVIVTVEHANIETMQSIERRMFPNGKNGRQGVDFAFHV